MVTARGTRLIARRMGARFGRSRMNFATGHTGGRHPAKGQHGHQQVKQYSPEDAGQCHWKVKIQDYIRSINLPTEVRSSTH